MKAKDIYKNCSVICKEELVISSTLSDELLKVFSIGKSYIVKEIDLEYDYVKIKDNYNNIYSFYIYRDSSIWTLNVKQIFEVED